MIRRCTIAVFLALATLPARADPDPDILFKRMETAPQSSVTITGPHFLVFQSGIKINVTTGQVTIPAGLPLDAASAEFWKGVEQLGAKLCQERK